MRNCIPTAVFFLVLFSPSFGHNSYATPLGPVIDNSLIGEPEVVCESASISLLFKTRNSFNGKVFVKGYVSEPTCMSVGDGKTAHRFEVRHDSCGVRRQREINGVVISATVIISFHSIFITKIDRAYRVSCFYVEGTKKVHNHVDISALTTQLLESQTQLPVCRYEIMNEAGGSAIKYARIGDQVYHKWTCVSELENVYCMKVHSCTVYDGQGGPPVTVIDANGCSVDGVILQNLEYTSDLTAGKLAPVFKFADKAGLYFNCQIQLTIKDVNYGCANTQPQCPSSQYVVEPAQKTTETAEPYPYAENHESGYPTRPANYVDPTTATPTTPQAYPSSPAPPPPGAYIDNSYPEPQPIYLSGTPDNTYDPIIGYNDTEQPFTTSSAYTEDGVYSRLIKRNVADSEQVGAKKRPVTVGDIDLPERGILVFGLEEMEEGESNSEDHGAQRALRESRSAHEKTCFSTSRMYFSLFLLCILFVATVVVFVVIVQKQRQILAQTAFFKP
uniref:ZP domain-containing protein n=1 Tax=Caenorhabditis japonica TaxID=281687 RepID=A0A8R1HU41_CAEJA